MRAVFVLLLVMLAAGLAIWSWNSSGEPTPNEAPVDDTSPVDNGEGVIDGARAVPTRIEVSAPQPEDLADRPTACLQVVDHAGGRPIAEAEIRRMKDGSILGFTDARGLAELPLKEREQLVIAADSFLLRLAPTRLGSTAQEPQRVQLVRDKWSVWHRFELRSPDGNVVDEAFVSIRMDQAMAPPQDADPVVSRARAEDLRILSLDARAGESKRVGNGDEVRFAKGMPYTLHFAARLFVKTMPLPPADRSRTIRVELDPGEFVHGHVLGDKAGALSGATLTQQGGDPLELLCTTTESGWFSFGPVPRGELTLLVRHPDHEPVAFPTHTSQDNARIVLRELPSSTLRGRVRRRPDLGPIGGATVSWTAAQNAPIITTTAADGTFRLASTGDNAGRLLVSAIGCIALEELVSPGAAFADYDLLPSSPAERLDKKLTALFVGVVVDTQSRPVADVDVRWIPNAPPGASAIPGRRTISGHVLLLPLSTTTRADGSFELETHRFGAGTLCLAADANRQGVSVEAIAGIRKDGIRLQQR